MAGGKTPKFLTTLPDTFNMERYRGKVSDSQLAAVLEFRRQLWFGIHDSNGTPKKLTDSQNCQFSSAILKLFSAPLTVVMPGYGMFRTASKDRIIDSAISEPSINDLAKYVRAFDELKAKAAETNADLFFSSSDPEGRYLGSISPANMRDFFPDAFNPNEFLLKIDLGLRGDDLIEHFSKFIKQLRETRESPVPESLRTRKTQTLKTSILSLPVLPYIDLKIWSVFQGVRIKPSLLAETLFGNTYDKAAAVRKLTDGTDSVDSYADMALSWEFVQSLRVSG